MGRSSLHAASATEIHSAIVNGFETLVPRILEPAVAVSPGCGISVQPFEDVLVAGFVTLYAAKGARLHRKAGSLFV